MKKINSIILAACVAALGFFSSCGGNGTDGLSASVTVQDHATGKVLLEQTEAKTVELWSIDGDNESNISATWKTQLDALVKNGNTVITGLTPGNYRLIVYNNDKTEKITKNFTINNENGGGGDPVLDWTKAVTSFIAAEGDVYNYKYDGVEKGTFKIASVLPGNKGYKVTFSDGITAEISYDGKSFLTASLTTITGVEASANTGATLLLYIVGETKEIRAGQLATFSGTQSTAKTTLFLKK
ncbi:MAG: hypothetical protein FWC39_02475 [Bacteroidetes bacterium]|nr:hypothetical protein [Bacteroidota bacterium]